LFFFTYNAFILTDVLPHGTTTMYNDHTIAECRVLDYIKHVSKYSRHGY